MSKNKEQTNKIHLDAAEDILKCILEKIFNKETKYIITIAGESGSGKTETGKALISLLEQNNIKSLLLNQDNYFFLPPTLNDARRKADENWLGPHIEVNLELLAHNINDAIRGEVAIEIPYIEYFSTDVVFKKVSVDDIKVIIAEGTYVSLLGNVDTRIFITSNYQDTLPYRKLRNRGNEVNDPFVENILKTEHKIIAGHRFLADFLISKENKVICLDKPA